MSVPKLAPGPVRSTLAGMHRKPDVDPEVMVALRRDLATANADKFLRLQADECPTVLTPDQVTHLVALLLELNELDGPWAYRVLADVREAAVARDGGAA